jgi:hypothetical protein
MNGPALAFVLIAAAFAFTIWYAWVGIYAPNGKQIGLSLAIWFLPLFYGGGWAAGYNLKETTLALVLLIFFGMLGWFKTTTLEWGAQLGTAMREKRQRGREQQDRDQTEL